MKILSLHYQRNGVCGDGFYQLVYENKEEGFKVKMTFVATFNTLIENNEELQCIDRRTCRITSIDYPHYAWRGDVMADDIQRYINKTFGKIDNTEGNTFYDLIGKICHKEYDKFIKKINKK